MPENPPKNPWRHDDIDGQLPKIPGQPDIKMPEPLKSTDRLWRYHDRLRFYLLAIGKDRAATESLAKFPDAIRPPKAWKELFTDMIRATQKTGHEWYSALATDKNGAVLLPKSEYMVKGDANHVSHSVIKAHHAWAKDKGAESVIGSFHTHPESTDYKSLFRRFFSSNSIFSAHDLYGLVIPNHDLVKGAIQTNKQLVVGFRSRETGLEESLGYLPKGYRDQESFADHWYRAHGLLFDKPTHSVSALDGRELGRDEWLDLNWKVNVSIAEKHYIALYRGDVGLHLSRYYPEPINTAWHDLMKDK